MGRNKGGAFSGEILEKVEVIELDFAQGFFGRLDQEVDLKFQHLVHEGRVVVK